VVLALGALLPPNIAVHARLRELDLGARAPVLLEPPLRLLQTRIIFASVVQRLARLPRSLSASYLPAGTVRYLRPPLAVLTSGLAWPLILFASAACGLVATCSP
jgi:hypothetical protein